MITAGQDREVRVTHTALAHQCRELSQGNIEKRAKELGLARTSEKLRLSPVIAMATCERYVGDWANVVTAHQRNRSVYAWNWARKALDAYVLPLPDVDPFVIGANTRRPNYATAVAISACGHYALVGGSLGTLSRFALQNGASHGEYPKAASHGGQVAIKGRKRRRGTMLGAPLPAPDRDIGKGKGNGLSHVPGSVTAALKAVFGADSDLSGTGFGDAAGAAGAAAAASASKLDHSSEAMLAGGASVAAVRATGSLPKQGGVSVGRIAHMGAVRGIAVDERNSVVLSAGADGALLWWSLSKHKLLQQVALGAPASMLATHRGSGLVAIALDDRRVVVYDLASRRRVRLLAGHSSIVQCISFSPDGRWVVTADMAGDLRVWDMPTGRCIDWMRFADPVTTVSLSPTGEFLATTHEGSLGVSLWLNRTYYGWIPADKVPTAPVVMDMPPVIQEGEGGLHQAEEVHTADSEEGHQEDEDAAETVPAGAAGTLVLSGAPPSHWVNLLHLDTIAARNKPTEAVKDKEAAPFFLPTAQGLAPSFVAEGAVPGGGSGSRLLNTLGGGSAGETGVAVADAPTKEFLRPLTTETARCAGAAYAGLVSAGVLATGPIPKRRQDQDQDGSDNEADTSADMPLPRKVLRAFTALEQHLKVSPPSAVDSELRTLCIGPDDHQGKRLLAGMCTFYSWQLRRLPHYELAQAQLAVLLQEYGSMLSDVAAAVEGRAPPSAKAPRGTMAKVKSASEHALLHALRDLLVIQQRASARVDSLMHESMCLVKYLSNLQ
jgi:U3 small nucleolar RNA-associated protein 21